MRGSGGLQEDWTEPWRRREVLGSARGLDRTTEEMRNSKGQAEKSVGSLSNKFDQAQEKKITELEERSFVSEK